MISMEQQLLLVFMNRFGKMLESTLGDSTTFTENAIALCAISQVIATLNDAKLVNIDEEKINLAIAKINLQSREELGI